MQNTAAKAMALARQRADDLRRIVCSHRCSDPKLIDFDDPDYELTLLVTSTKRTSLLDIGAIMTDIERELGIRAFVVTHDSYEATAAIRGSRPPVLAL